ncbi:MAG: methionyl-tRNA formyltransferase [Bacillota bacterium]|nr:methionyl-tRNA formyltransferase [Bacillota bacterium]
MRQNGENEDFGIRNKAIKGISEVFIVNLNVLFLGTPEFALPSLRKLITANLSSLAVVTRPDRPAGRMKQNTPTPVKVEALKNNLDLFQPIDRDDLLNVLREIKPQVLINVAFGMFLPNAVLEFPPLGCINLHPSLLPAYRGAAPIQRAVMAGEEYTGVTVMYMSSRMDAGDIILQEKTSIGSEENFGSLYDRLAELGAAQLHKALGLLNEGKAPCISQDEEKVSYAPAISREDEKIAWEKPASEIFNLVRALNPAPGAFTIFRSKRLKIWRASVQNIRNLQPCLVPETSGTICFLHKDCIEVTTGRGMLKILELQPEGKRRMSARDFLKGNDLKVGEKFE